MVVTNFGWFRMVMDGLGWLWQVLADFGWMTNGYFYFKKVKSTSEIKISGNALSCTSAFAAE